MVVVLLVRVVQLLLAAIVLALSAVLIAQYGPGGSAPSIIDYGAFCGGASLVIALVGVAACFIESLQGIITLALDGLATFFLLAGGIAFAATIKVGSCTDGLYLYDHQNTFLPSDQKIENEEYFQGDAAALNDLEKRCRMVQADTAFLWFAFAASAAAVVLSNMSRKSGLGGSIV